MTTNRIQRTARIGVLSTFFALVAFSFLAFGAASAQTVSQAHINQSSSPAQTVRSCISNTVHLRSTLIGPAFSCKTLTVKVGSPVTFVNNTAETQFVVNNDFSILIRLVPGGTGTLQPSQPGQLHLAIYDLPATLTITVVA